MNEKILENISLATKTTYRIGGMARYYSAIVSNPDIVDALSFAQRFGVDLLVMGKGSNLLVSDEGWPGLVLDFTNFDTIEWEGEMAHCAAGALLHTLVRESVDRGYAGAEELAGIPGTVGGALFMNAGAFGQTISETVQTVTGINSAEKTLWKLNRSEIEFGYRWSSLQVNKRIITGSTFLFRCGDKEAIRQTMNDTLKKRGVKQPLDLPNCGSVFKRPPGNYAGTLVEQAGCKGFSIGGAQVSEKHANFIVNTGGATARDVRRVIAHVQQRVYENSAVLLEPEVIFIGQFDEPLFVPK